MLDQHDFEQEPADAAVAGFRGRGCAGCRRLRVTVIVVLEIREVHVCHDGACYDLTRRCAKPPPWAENRRHSQIAEILRTGHAFNI